MDKQFELYKEYNISDIEKHAEKNDFNITQFGEFFIGKNVVILESKLNGDEYTFLKTGYSTRSIYTLVWMGK
jgi:enolase